MSIFRLAISAICALAISLCIVPFSAADPGGTSSPGWVMETASPVSPEEAEQYFAVRAAELGAPIAPLAATTAGPELVELARGLRYDPKLIFDYVHNRIDYVPYYGSLKGATLTYLDGSGNDFDQASLLVALLRESSNHNAAIGAVQYVYGKMKMPSDVLSSWLGVADDWNAIIGVLGNGGIPMNKNASGQVVLNPDGTITFDRIWVKATIGGVDYLFDPACKTYAYTNKIDIGLATGYDPADFLASALAGATVTPDYAQSLNETNIRGRLATYSTNLVNAIRTQYPNHDITEIVGGRRIVQTTMTAYTPTLPFSPTVTTSWTDIPADRMTTIRIQYAGINYIAQSHDLSGKRLTVTYNVSNGGNRPELRIDGALVATGSITPVGSVSQLLLSIDHPYAASDGQHGNGSYMDQKPEYGNSPPYTLIAGSSYAIVYNFGGVSHLLLQKQQEALNTYRNQGLADTSEPVLGETLHIMGTTWLKEVQMSNRLLSALAETNLISHHMVGMMAQETGYYIDVKTSMSSITSRHNTDADHRAHFKITGLLGSAFEHGMLEQLMGTGNPGVSTMKLFQIANSGAKKIFHVTSANYGTIQPQLTNYSSSDLSTFQTSINIGRSLILPADGQLVSGQWKGKGYMDIYFAANSSSMGMIIGGSYFGGYGSYTGTVSSTQVSTYTQPAITNTYTPSTIYTQVTPVQTPTSREPVDMAGGAYLFDHADLSLGSEAPLGLVFSRSYNSNRNLLTRSLGYGWTHNYDISLAASSHADPGLGSRQPTDAASAIASMYVILDLLKNQSNIQGWVAASLASKWAMDQLTDNAVTVSLGSKVMEFVKMADATYAAPPGITTQLLKNPDNTFSLKERFGTTMNFDIGKRISSLTDIDGNAMTFTYTGNNLTTVTDAVNRTLTLTYDAANRVKKVADSSGRFVEYGYDASGNLTTFTDAEAKVWGYGYDAGHRMTSLTNPLMITTATNAYDSLGRVKTQTVPRQGGTTGTYAFYFSGYRNQEVDPFGNAITYFFDGNGRSVAEENALGYRSHKKYDGQNHVVLITDPRGKSTGFVYDGNHNITRVTTPYHAIDHVHDVQFRLTDTIDGLMHGSHFDYDSKHHLLVSRHGGDYSSGPIPPAVWLYQTQSTYYPSGLEHTATDGRNTVITFTYDAYGNPKTSRTGTHPEITYAYDAIGRMTGLTDQVGSSTSFVFDKRNFLTTKTDPLLKTTVLTYDNAGRLLSGKNRNNNTITYAYTPSDKIEKITYPDTKTVTFTYNNHDQLTSMLDSLGTSSYSYDAAGRLISSTNPYGLAVSYTYDENGNLTELIYPGNRTVIYGYDDINRLTTITNWLGQTASYQYDAAGRMESFTNFNGIVTTYTHDNSNRLKSITHRKPDASVIASYSFTLDGNGNRTDIVQTEPFAPVPAAGTVDYGYNAKKNRMLTASGQPSAFSYDDEGQLATGYGGAYAFDYEHRLTAISSQQSAFSYDGAGNRLKAVRNGVETRYIYDAAGNLLAEADGSNVITKYFIHGAGLVAMVTPTDQVYSYHFNAVGSTVAMTDQTQAVINAYAYDEFGGIMSQSEAVAQPFKFVGEYGVMTEPNGFYYMRARYYDPAVGRFISEDPIGFGGGDVNLMAYVGNSPVMGVDPSGELGILAIRAGIGAINGAIAGFTAGAMRGNIGAGIAGGVAGGVVGAVVGAVLPSASSYVGGAIGGAFAGAVGGAAGGAISARIAGSNVATGALVGAGIGAASGAVGGVAGYAVARVGVAQATRLGATAQALAKGSASNTVKAVANTAMRVTAAGGKP